MPEHQYLQPDARSHIPHVGTYRRVLPVSLERMYENALDWAHLPHLHDSSFSAIDCIEAGTWGWRARTTDSRGGVAVLELALDKQCRRWITRNLEGPNVGAEIWTHAFEIGPRRVDIVVDFFVPDVPVEARAKVGQAYGRSYERLYDEDVRMMTGRQREIDTRLESLLLFDERHPLGARSELALPVSVKAFGRRYHVAEVDGDLVAYSAVCPHQMGPMNPTPDAEGIVDCPWHGYRFDVTSGACVSGSACRLQAAPEVILEGGQVILIRPDLPG